MFYVCVENKQVISICDYEPSVPKTVSIFPISPEDHSKILKRSHFFDTKSNKVIQIDTPSPVDQSLANLEFLTSTDWKVLRHIRQQALGIPTSLSEEEYLELEKQRQIASEKIGKAPR